MKCRWSELLFLLWLAGCATYHPIAVVPGDSAALKVRTLYIDVPAELRDRAAMRSRVVAAVKREAPWLAIVDHPALADATMTWVIHTGQMCIDCGDDTFTGYSWQGELRAYHGSGLVMFSGSSRDSRCCPDDAFLRQFARYLKHHAVAPFARGAGERQIR